MLCRVLLVAAIISLVQSAPLRAEWNTGRTNIVPSRVILFRLCGPAPPGISCSTELENVAVACKDIHQTYLCHAQTWFSNGK